MYEQGRIKGARGPREDAAKAPKWYRKSPRLVSGCDNLTPVVAINKFEFVRMSGTSKLLYIHFYALNMFFCVFLYLNACAKVEIVTFRFCKIPGSVTAVAS